MSMPTDARVPSALLRAYDRRSAEVQKTVYTCRGQHESSLQELLSLVQKRKSRPAAPGQHQKHHASDQTQPIGRVGPRKPNPQSLKVANSSLMHCITSLPGVSIRQGTSGKGFWAQHMAPLAPPAARGSESGRAPRGRFLQAAEMVVKGLLA